jgi:exodeoxyribonuclease VII large subunit
MMQGIDLKTVSAATAILKDRLEDLPQMLIEGEVSNLRPPNASGHLYFTLGDETAKLNAAFFAYRQRLHPPPVFHNGDKVHALGRFSLYPPSGSYHLVVEKLLLADGQGVLKERFEALKKKLFEEGLCDPSRKRPLPKLPKRIGIVTAPTGAAIRDILNILNRRFPNLHILLAPCRVQGQEAVEEIAHAIALLNRHFGPESDEPLDAMIVGRGGGSLEDLWCFNEERVARAVVASRIPVISAVGHEPDIASTDFVADVRAPTPSAAAELICGCKDEIEQQLAIKKERLLVAMRSGYATARNRVRYYEGSALFRDPMHVLELRSQAIDHFDSRLTNLCTHLFMQQTRRIREAELRLEALRSHLISEAQGRNERTFVRMQHALERSLERAQSLIREHQAKLEAYNPFAVLSRGYALTTNARGEVITDVKQVTAGETLDVRLHQGVLKVTAQTSEPLHSPQSAVTKRRTRRQGQDKDPSSLEA